MAFQGTTSSTAARQDFERALDNALEQQYNGAMQIEAIKAVENAVGNLEERLEKVVGKISDRLYIRGQGSPEGVESDREILRTHEPWPSPRRSPSAPFGGRLALAPGSPPLQLRYFLFPSHSGLEPDLLLY